MLHSLDLVNGTGKTKLAKGLANYKKYLESINENVSPKTQRLFNDLSKQYQCEWIENDVIYIKEFEMLIRPPYSSKNCEGGSDNKAKDRVMHILNQFNLKSHSQ